MTELYIVKVRLKLTLWFVAAAFCCALFAAFHYHGAAAAGEGEQSYFMSCVISGALLIAWVVLFAFFLAARRISDVGRYRNGILNHIPWWSIKVILLLIVIGGVGYGLHYLSRWHENEFVLLRRDELVELETRIVANAALLDKKDLKNGLTLTMTAFRENRMDALKMLLSHGGVVDALDEENRSTLVISMDDPELFSILLENGVDPNTLSIDGSRPVHSAVSKSLDWALTALVAAGVSVDARDQFERTPLMYAIENGDLHMASLLIEMGADLNALDRRGDTPLHWATRRNRERICEELLAEGADPTIFNFAGFTPLHVAAANGSVCMVRMFSGIPGLVSLSNKKGLTPFRLAIEGGSYDSADVLLEQGADVNEISDSGDSLLMEAILRHEYRSARFLIRHNADVDYKNPSGISAHDLMTRMQLTGLLELTATIEEASCPTNSTAVTDSP